MLSCWVLVLALLGGACALPAPLGYSQALTQAVDSYNQRPEVQNAFRLLSADPEPGPVSACGDSVGTAWGYQGTAWGNREDAMGRYWGHPGDGVQTLWGQRGDTGERNIMGTSWERHGDMGGTP